MLYHLDCDCKGVPGDFIEPLNAGRFVSTKIGSLDEWRSVTDSLTKQVKAGDLVIIDTLNLLLDGVRAEVRTRNTQGKPLTQTISLMAEQGAYGADVGVAGALIWPPLKNLVARDAHLIVNVHQKTGDFVESTMKRKGPYLPDAFFTSLNGKTNHMFRLGKVLNDIVEADQLIAEKDTRILFLKEGYDDIIKTDASRARQARWGRGWILDPTLPILREALGLDPTWLTIYSPPGVGKTTFALSDLLEETT